MRSLWNRCISLVKRSQSVVPMRLRQGGVGRGEVTLNMPATQSEHVMVRAMVSLTGPDYRIQQGEQLRLIDNNDTYLWQVQTSTGIVEVPSICFWIMGTDAGATERATA